MTDPSPSTGAEIAMQGLVQAIEAVSGRDPIENQIAIGHALFWAMTLDELLRSAYPGAYEAARDAHHDGLVVEGGRLARNGIVHGAVIVQAMQDGLVFPLEFPLRFKAPAWVSLDDLLSTWAPKPSSHLDQQKSSYSTHFAGRPGVEPLSRILSWLRDAASVGFVV